MEIWINRTRFLNNDDTISTLAGFWVRKEGHFPLLNLKAHCKSIKAILVPL